MAMYKFKNDFHNTEACVRLPKGVDVLSARQVRRMRKKLCGMSNCACGVIRGPQETEYNLAMTNSSLGYTIKIVNSINDLVDVVLVDYGRIHKIKAIKGIREVTDLGLREAFDVANNVPCIIVKNITREKSKDIKAILIEYGCVVNIVDSIKGE